MLMKFLKVDRFKFRIFRSYITSISPAMYFEFVIQTLLLVGKQLT